MKPLLPDFEPIRSPHDTPGLAVSVNIDPATTGQFVVQGTFGELLAMEGG